MTARIDTTALWPETVGPHSTMREAARGGHRIELESPITFGMSTTTDFDVLRLLTAAAEHGVPVEWTLGSAVPWGLDTVVHLPPPARADSAAGKGIVAEWRERHQVGLCFYRYGPDFIAIRDIRCAGKGFRALLDEPHATRFRELSTASRVSVLTKPDLELLEDLHESGLTLIDGDEFVLLPHRLRTFPIPYTAV